MRTLRATLSVLAFGLATACSVKLQKSDQASTAANRCTADSDCANGTCRSGVCAAFEGTLSTLLLEITPPTTAPFVGGTQFLRVARDLGGSNDDYPINLSSTSVVQGFVSLGKGCAAGSSVPMEIVFTPREQTYGLPAVTYVAQTAPVTAPGLATDACAAQFPKDAIGLQEFTLNLPGGQYDAYVRPLETPLSSSAPDAGVAASCDFVAQVFSGVTVKDGLTQCLPLPASVPNEITVEVRWPKNSSTLDGFSVDVIHPLTGQILSNRATLHGSASDLVSDVGLSQHGTTTPTGYSTTVRYSSLSPGDAKAGHELVRLSPPAGLVAPTFQFDISGLEAVGSVRKAIVPPFGTFSKAVRFDPQIRDANGNAATGIATFAATRLDGINSGVFASFSATGVVGSTGGIEGPDGGGAGSHPSASGIWLLPGDYRIRIVPDVASGLAAIEKDDIPVPGTDALPTIHVANKETLRGTVSVPGGAGLDAATVQALPASATSQSCGQGADAAVCRSTPLGVINAALARDAFLPRSVSGVVAAGGFDLAVDCGGCTASDEALFDLSVRPSDGTGLPWAAIPGVRAGTGNLAVSIPLPVVVRGVVQIPSATQASIPVPNALIRAYVLRDDRGAPILDPDPGCSSLSSSAADTGSARCARSVLQVAQTRAGDDGAFELLLPAKLSAAP